MIEKSNLNLYIFKITSFLPITLLCSFSLIKKYLTLRREKSKSFI